MTDLDARFRHASLAVKERVRTLPLPNVVAGEPRSAPKPSRVLALLSAAALVLLVAGIAVFAIHSRTRVVTPGRATPRIVDVDVRNVSPGTVITTRYTVAIGELHKAPVFLARQPDGRFVAFLGRSTHLGCRIVLAGTIPTIANDRAAFYDPCGGSVWAIDGTCLGGPAPRNLDRFPLTIVAGHAHLDLSTILPGEPRPPRPGNETSDVLVFDETGGTLTADFTTHVATRHPLHGWRAGDQPFLSLRVGNNFVVGWGEVHATPFAGRSSRILGTGVFVPASEPGAVWLTSFGQIQTPTERLVDMHGRILMQGRTPLDPGTSTGVPALAGVPGGLVLQTATGLDIWDARTGHITRHLGTSRGSAAPAFGSLLAWCDHCNQTLELTDVTTGVTRSIPLALAGASLTMNRPTFSPDGTQLAIPAWPDAAAPTGATTKVITVNVSTGEVTNQIDTHERYASIAWSPDSQRIYIAATNSGSAGDILVHDQPTSTTRDLGPAPSGADSLSTVMAHDDAALLLTPTPGTAATCRPTGSPTSPGGNQNPCSYHF